MKNNSSQTFQVRLIVNIKIETDSKVAIYSQVESYKVVSPNENLTNKVNIVKCDSSNSKEKGIEGKTSNENSHRHFGDNGHPVQFQQARLQHETKNKLSTKDLGNESQNKRTLPQNFLHKADFRPN